MVALQDIIDSATLLIEEHNENEKLNIIWSVLTIVLINISLTEYVFVTKYTYKGKIFNLEVVSTFVNCEIF